MVLPDGTYLRENAQMSFSGNKERWILVKVIVKSYFAHQSLTIY